MHRLDPKLKQLESEDSASPEVRQAIQEREQELLPVYQQIAVHFADLHDRPGRMMAKNCLNGIIEVFYLNFLFIIFFFQNQRIFILFIKISKK